MPVSYDLDAIADRVKVSQLDPSEMTQSDLDRQYLLACLYREDKICCDLARQVTEALKRIHELERG